MIKPWDCLYDTTNYKINRGYYNSRFIELNGLYFKLY